MHNLTVCYHYIYFAKIVDIECFGVYVTISTQKKVCNFNPDLNLAHTCRNMSP
jgi:hypothetical protein